MLKTSVIIFFSWISQFIRDERLLLNSIQMNEPSLDKIIGSSIVTKNTFTVHYQTGSIAYAAGGFISIIASTFGKKQSEEQHRYDYKLANDCREITALSFSTSGQYLAVGETGQNARFFILKFNDPENWASFTKTEYRTKENGIICIAYDDFSTKNRLFTVGCDDQPYVLIWDMFSADPKIIGYYKLPTIPLSFSISPTSSFAFAVSSHSLTLLNTNTQTAQSTQASPMRAIRLNLGKYSGLNFVDCTFSPNNTAFAIASDGTLLIFSPSRASFTRYQKNVTLQPTAVHFSTKRGVPVSISVDDKSIFCGTSYGQIFSAKNNPPYAIFGQLGSPSESNEKSVSAFGISSSLVVSAYSDGSLLFWPRRVKSAPLSSFPSHRGPICGLTIHPDKHQVISCGSDGTIRFWNLQKGEKLISKSSQSQQHFNKLNIPKNPNSDKELCGCRCITSSENYVFAGDNAGTLHILSAKKLTELGFMNEAGKPITAITAFSKIINFRDK